jgi:signal transduction histidine kinase
VNYSLEGISAYINVSINRLRGERTKEVLLFFLLCVAINLIGGIDTASRRLLYLDMLGTALAGIALGPWWGASVGLVTNILLYLMLPESPSLLVFAVVNILGGLYWGYMCNLKYLKPIEGITSIQKFFKFEELKKALWFIIMSGGLVLSLPVLFILKYVLGYITEDVSIERYMYYIIINMTDKLLCVVIATVIICSFFPALASHLLSEKPQVSYGVSTRSIVWFWGLYFIPCVIYFRLYPEYWYFWLLPYVLATIVPLSMKHKPLPVRYINIDLSAITYGALFWLVLASVATFIEFVYFAAQNVTSKYNIYHVDGVIQYKLIIADAFSLSLVLGLIGIVFAVLIQAVKQRESREILKRVEVVRDKIATDIHNDPLQLISVLRRKISTIENHINKIKDNVDHMHIPEEETERINKLRKSLNDLNKTFCNYYATYLPELDTSIRRIIKPLSQKDSYDLLQVGLIQKIKDLLNEFKERNKEIMIHENIPLTEEELPQSRSDNKEWQIETLKIIKEILNNTEKHAGASELYVSMNVTKQKAKHRLCITITDNGKGFNHDDALKNTDSIGMYEITTRAKEIGATINIEYLFPEKENNKGTTVQLEIPYDY